MTKTYSHYCNHCEEETLNVISYINRRRGVKLECLKCGLESKRYVNFGLLMEVIK
jgi:hypothetical protein